MSNWYDTSIFDADDAASAILDFYNNPDTEENLAALLWHAALYQTPTPA